MTVLTLTSAALCLTSAAFVAGAWWQATRVPMRDDSDEAGA